jgi:hypothetical protein
LTDTHKSALALALEARERKCHEFEAANFLGAGAKPIGKVAIRIATKAEQDRAVLAAHAYVEKLAKGAQVDPRLVADDRDILTDAKTCHILHEVCRDSTDPKYPAFPGPVWMIEHLSTDEIAVLLNHYTEVLRTSGAIESDFSPDRVSAIACLLAEHADTDGPNLYLLRYTREQLTELCVLLAIKLAGEKERGDRSTLDAAEARAQLDALSTKEQ